MKRVTHTAAARDRLLHIETDGCIVNIRVGLSDMHGNRVTSVEIIPDQYAGEPEWTVDGPRNVRVIRAGGAS